MKISTRGRYGLRAMVDLAIHQDSGAIPLREIAERQQISEQYLEQLFANLRKAGLVKSVRGAHGGYLLNRDADEITAGDVLRTLEGPIAPTDCVLDNDEDVCSLIDKCVTHELWVKLQKQVSEILDSVTLRDLQERAKELIRNKNKGLMYHI
ncbi:RrF2 family transcriptional regulator [Halothermothrix orenii]|uniref:Transcriptional regulator, BadM/Rrf2 family n=1 Tax=Halothermothrix orenii (strain H 168 / OCM 544 / DSM 9562) TaxID=373903 RepID=B8CWH4_HALOH|nr:Rrf2 family transcriptional regulator [Halothermothrix orenii]ACL69643.1 transcriptional regulator, BadM/Rrf2 family [Halothermothrix orenii H 168]